MMMATVIMLLNFIIVFGAVTLPHLANPVFLWIWISFVIGSLVIGGFGLADLIRAGSFKRLKDREAPLYLMKVEQGRQTLPEEAKSAIAGAEAIPSLMGPPSVTETTTRELKPIPRANKRELP